MVSEQNKDDEIVEFKTILIHGEPSKEVKRRYLVIDEVLYCLTYPDCFTVICS